MKERERKGGSKGCFVVVVVAVLVRALVYANVGTVFLMRKLVLVLVLVLVSAPEFA